MTLTNQINKQIFFPQNLLFLQFDYRNFSSLVC